MSLADIAKDALKDLPISEIVRERLSLALDQSAVFERQVGELQTKVGRLEAQLDITRGDRDKAQEQLRDLQQAHEEEIRIEHTVEFRRGFRTNGKWLPFCPKCHLPASLMGRKPHCSANCGWIAGAESDDIARMMQGMNPMPTQLG
jgi:hypothetical protein